MLHHCWKSGAVLTSRFLECFLYLTLFLLGRFVVFVPNSGHGPPRNSCHDDKTQKAIINLRIVFVGLEIGDEFWR